MNIFLIIAVSIINPIFEEAIVVGYIIPVLKDRTGVLFAINISVLVRLLYHLYQGPIAAITIIPMGLIFAFVYTKWKNIWPLIIAHSIMDFIAFSFYQF
jgi:membrane protease YdiL (CAAX protease family)